MNQCSNYESSFMITVDQHHYGYPQAGSTPSPLGSKVINFLNDTMRHVIPHSKAIIEDIIFAYLILTDIEETKVFNVAITISPEQHSSTYFHHV